MNAIEISTQAEVRSRLARLALRCGAREREWEHYLEEVEEVEEVGQTTLEAALRRSFPASYNLAGAGGR